MKSSKKYDDKLKQLALEYGLDLRPDNTAPAHFGQVFDSAADRTIRGRIGVYCSCETKDSEGKEASHAIGIVKSLEGTIRFFDCNVGAYKFESQFKFTEFYEHWGMLYRTKLELDIGTRCWGYLVGDISGVRPAKPEGATRRSLAQLGWATTRQ